MSENTLKQFRCWYRTFAAAKASKVAGSAAKPWPPNGRQSLRSTALRDAVAAHTSGSASVRGPASVRAASPSRVRQAVETRAPGAKQARVAGPGAPRAPAPASPRASVQQSVYRPAASAETVRRNAVSKLEASTGMGCQAVVVYDGVPLATTARWTTRCPTAVIAWILTECKVCCASMHCASVMQVDFLIE